ncbi:MAG TPA: hypothetical protein VGE76_10915 [Opitutaceae bacterium]
MKTCRSLLLLAALLGLLASTGCTHTSYIDPATGAKFTRTTVLSSQQIGDVKVKAGDKELSIGSYSTTQAEATGTLLGAALKAAAKP